KIFILNNQWMGMVRQWQELLHGERYSESYTDSLPDFVKLAEAYGGMAVVARDAGITREALYRALSPKGNPTLKTLLAVLHAMDMRLSVTTDRTQGLTPPQGNTCRPA
ncbi:MAG: thiamine pyrophosphate-dependent enzyme, partial [Halioglobus sp.]